MKVYQSFFDELFIQLRTSIPASLNAMGNSLPWLISVAFVGGIGADELAAAALATSICNITGLSLATGMSSAVTTLAGQCKGEVLDRKRRRLKNESNGQALIIEGENQMKDYDSIQVEHNVLYKGDAATKSNCPITPDTYLYRGIFVQIMIVLPICFYWIYGVTSLFIALGQQERISAMAADYLRILTPGLLAYSINFVLSTWLQAIGMADVPMYGVFIGFLLHIPMNFFFIYTLGLGYNGAAVATTLFRIAQPTVTIVYICFTNIGRDRIYVCTGADALDTPIPLSFELQRAICSYKGICQYLGLALPGLIMISEWWASEVALILSGYLSPPAVTLAAFSIFQSLIAFCFKFAAGTSIACSARVSSLLGARDAEGAKFASQVSLLYAFFSEFAMAAVLYFTPHTFFPSIFTKDVDVIQVTSKTLPYLAVYVFADGMEFVLNGIIRGIGKQFVVMPIPIIAYWLVGLPLAYYFAFQYKSSDVISDSTGSFKGITGLVLGSTIGTWTHLILLGLTVWLGTNWEKEVERAQERLKLEKEENMTAEKDIDLETNIASGTTSTDSEETALLRSKA